MKQFELDCEKYVGEYSSDWRKMSGGIEKTRKSLAHVYKIVSDVEWFEVMRSPCHTKVLEDEVAAKDALLATHAKLTTMTDWLESAKATTDKFTDDGCNCFHSSVFLLRCQRMEACNFLIDSEGYLTLIKRNVDELWAMELFDNVAESLSITAPTPKSGSDASSPVASCDEIGTWLLVVKNKCDHATALESSRGILLTKLSSLLWNAEDEANAIAAGMAFSRGVRMLPTEDVDALVAGSHCLGWKGSTKPLAELRNFRETLKGSTKLARQYQNCSHSGTVLDQLDKELLAEDGRLGDKSKLGRFADTGDQMEPVINRYGAAGVTVLAKMRVEFINVMANQCGKFKKMAQAEIARVDQHLQKGAAVIEMHFVDSLAQQFADAVGPLLASLAHNDDADKSDASVKVCKEFSGAIDSMIAKLCPTHPAIVDHANVASQKRHSCILNFVESIKQTLQFMTVLHAFIFSSHGAVCAELGLSTDQLKDKHAHARIVLSGDLPNFLRLDEYSQAPSASEHFATCWCGLRDATLNGAERMTRAEIETVTESPEWVLFAQVAVRFANTEKSALDEMSPFELLSDLCKVPGEQAQVLDLTPSSITAFDSQVAGMVKLLGSLPQSCPLAQSALSVKGDVVCSVQLAACVPTIAAFLRAAVSAKAAVGTTAVPDDVCPETFLKAACAKAKQIHDDVSQKAKKLITDRAAFHLQAEIDADIVNYLGNLVQPLRAWLLCLARSLLPVEALESHFQNHPSHAALLDSLDAVDDDSSPDWSVIYKQRKSSEGRELFRLVKVIDKVFDFVSSLGSPFEKCDIYTLVAADQPLEASDLVAVFRQAFRLKALFAAQQILGDLGDAEPNKETAM